MTTETALTMELHGLLRLDEDDPARLASRENSRLEYKESFNWANRAKYGKTLAAFANVSGGGDRGPREVGLEPMTTRPLP